jgi:hypothetical protein
MIRERPNREYPLINGKPYRLRLSGPTEVVASGEVIFRYGQLHRNILKKYFSKIK